MHPDLLDREKAEELVEAIHAIDGVAGLDGGQFGEVAMLFPGKRIRGIHVSKPRGGDGSARFEVNIVADLATLPNLAELATNVRNVVMTYVDIPVDVTVADAA